MRATEGMVVFIQGNFCACRDNLIERKNRGKYIQKSICQINSDYVQLSLCQHGIRDHDGECRIQMVLFTAGQPDGVHRSVSICACDATFKRIVNTHHGAHSIFDEQQAELLCTDICGWVQPHGKAEIIYDTYNDGWDLCRELHPAGHR